MSYQPDPPTPDPAATERNEMTTEFANPMGELIRHLSTLETGDLTRIATVGARFALVSPQSPLTGALSPLVSWLLHESPRGPILPPAGLSAQQLRESAWVTRGAAVDLLQAEPGAAELALAFQLYASVLETWASRRATLN